MDHTASGEGPAILQLHKWGPSELPLNLSEYHEAFISPTRELLLLLSYQCQALLLPLTTGGSVDADICQSHHDERPQNLDLLACRSNLKDDIPCTSGSAIDSDNGISLEPGFSRCNGYPFIYDVNSLAWGVCGDTYNQHKDGSFRELLFVSGNQGVMVHAFSQPDKSRVTEAMLAGEFREGTWVEWGPSSSSFQHNNKEKTIDLSFEASQKTIENSITNGNLGVPDKICKKVGADVLSGTDTSKRWLRSFFTKAETVEYEGGIWTRFPPKSSFPCSAKVVSFSIFTSDFPVLRFLSKKNSSSSGEGCRETIRNLKNGSHENVELDTSDVGSSTSYKCCRVFSSSSHHIIGFFLTLMNSASFNAIDGSEKRIKNIIVIARLNIWGIQWVSLVKLPQNENTFPLDDWKDFHFSGDFLICLNASGLVFFYNAVSGEHVAHLDILRACELQCFANLREPERSTLNDDMQNKSNYQHSDLFGRRTFKRLLVASYTPLLAVVDEFNIVYVIYAGDCLPDKCCAFEKLLPHYQHLGLGMLVGWDVGSSDVSHQKIYIGSSNSCNLNSSSKTNEILSFCDNIGNNILQKIHGWKRYGNECLPDSILNGFSSASKVMNEKVHDSKIHFHLMRKIFLPTDRYSDDDCICFSPFGITRFIRRQNIKDRKSSQIVHFNLHTDSIVQDDRFLNLGSKNFSLQGRVEVSIGEAVGCTFQGCFYLVADGGLSVVLPSVSVSSNLLPIETTDYQQSGIGTGVGCHTKNILGLEEPKMLWSPWKVEILDKVLLYEGPEEADRLCLENGWDLKFSRMRQLQIALDYLKFDEVKQSLEMLVGVNLAEEGVLRLLFAAVYLMFGKNGNDNEVSAASRLLKLATWFATKMIHEYGLNQLKRDAFMFQGLDRPHVLALPSVLPDKTQNEVGTSTRLREMAHFLEIIRNLQYQLRAKLKKPGQGLVDRKEQLSMVDPSFLQDEFQFSTPSVDSLETLNEHELQIPALAFPPNNNEKLALVPKNAISTEAYVDLEDPTEAAALIPRGMGSGKILPTENPKEMIARWEIDNLDLKTVVKDALLSGRLPLAVLQLHLHRSIEFNSDEEPHDTFNEVSDIGRDIAYDLFLKGETELAIATLQRLGEDVEICLKQLLFGTVRKTLRVQIAEKMKRYGYLGSVEWKIMERISLIERIYPSCSFWKTFHDRMKECMHVSSTLNPPEGIHLCLLDFFNNLKIECGEIDGVVLGAWANVNENSSDTVLEQDDVHTGYWAAAAVWSKAWDQRTIDRIVLDQPFVMGVHVSWESQLEYHIYHNDWEEVFKLLDLIPTSVLSIGSLQIALDGFQPASTIECSGFPDFGNYMYSVEELDAVCMDVPDVKIFRLSSIFMCSTWLRILIEKELVKKLIFLKEYWEGTAEVASVLARSGFITKRLKISFEDNSTGRSWDTDFSSRNENFRAETVQALDKLLIRYCAQHNLPNLLDLYLDRHKLVVDDESLLSLQEAAGDCHWARWLLLSRFKGHEYDASFENARSIMSRNLIHDGSLHGHEVDEIIYTIDDIAEGGGEMAALATLMYASAPIPDCLTSGSVNRHNSSTAQCTLENLRPTLQHYPTLWRTLVSGCFGQDTSFGFSRIGAKNALAEYLNWRDNIFFSTGHDTSLLQMLPFWFPKAVRRLIQLYLQGPLGWQSLSGLPTGESLLDRDVDFYINADEQAEINAISWEATIQKHVEEELYHSSLKETGLGLEHHLHRGRALAAFNHLLISRVETLKMDGRSNASGQTNVQSDVQILLAPISEKEGCLLSSVMPFAITHFEDNVLVASCSFLLELCGISASMLQVDVASLRRISFFHKSIQNKENSRQLPSKGSAFHAATHDDSIMESLARALADECMHGGNSTQRGSLISVSSKQHSRVLMLVLQHLEKASLPQLVEGRTCGSWLLTGNGDGTELRSQQKAASKYWSLVTLFCQIHQLPLSTKYLAVLARDNDWVGFLCEAQIGGYSFDTVFQVASKDFSDPRLKIHILTVLKSMQSKKMASSQTYLDKKSENPFPEENVYIPIEFFRVLADCEKQKNPGEALLLKAKDFSWSILSMIASCFPDVSPLACLTVWLEITAARETKSIKVNDIASQIADNVAAAVEATNSWSCGSRSLSFHYNRRNPKRRRLLESLCRTPFPGASDSSTRIFSAECSTAGEEKKIELGEQINVSSDFNEGPASLAKMVAVLCEQRLFLPLLRAFELFLPSCSFLPFIRALQAFSQMRLSEASAHLGSFSARIKEEPSHLQTNIGREGQIGMSWISSTAIKAADATLSTCPSPYEKRCLLQLLAAADFGDGGSAAARYRQLYWKINLAEPSLRKNDDLHLGNETLDDASLLTALEENMQWEQARNWARQLEASGGPWKSTFHQVTETQAESMVAEWKEFLWDVPEERVALWGHCQTLFIRYSYPALQAGLFFLKHAEAVEKDLPARELHEMLLLSLQWLSGMITKSNPVYPLHLLREIETRIWLLAVESEAQGKSEGEIILTGSSQNLLTRNISSIIDRTASIIAKMDNHINSMKNVTVEKYDSKEPLHRNQALDSSSSTVTIGSSKTKRRAKGYVSSRRTMVDPVDKGPEPEDSSNPPNLRNDVQLQDESLKIEISFSKWEERIGPGELERAVLSLLEFGQISAAKQLQQKLSPGQMPSELILVDAALKLAAMSTPTSQIPIEMLDEELLSVIQSYKPIDQHLIYPLQVLETLATVFTEGSGRGLCKRIIAVVKAANVLGLSFSEAFGTQAIELLQLLSLKAQESFEEANLLVRTHVMPSASIAQILAETFLKGLLAAHRGGYMDSQKEEGPAPLLWRFSDFLKWAELCPSEPEVGHALMRLVITGQEIPLACEVELLILSHHFYKSSACLDGVDVLVALAATRVEAYVSEGDFACLARLITGVGNFYALNFILGILIENGQLGLLLQKYSAAANTTAGTVEADRGFRMAVLTSLKRFNPYDLDAFAMVYNHFDMKHETASLLESRAEQASLQWFECYDRDQNEDLLESMRYYIEAAEVHASIDAGNKTRRACAQASLVSLQIRIPDSKWLHLSETNARRALVEQSRFLEALIVAEAYGLNQPAEWALVLWNQMLNPELTEIFVAEFVAVLPLQPSMLIELARFYRAEVVARGDQSQFSVWLTGGGLPAEWAKYLGRSFRCLLKRTRDLRLRLQLATSATGFTDVVDACMKALDRFPDTAAPLVLRKGHGGAYLPLM
ncbi:ubiquitin carboxyl-terminal hydrolase 27-like [Hibiscus syriacus]|uniref:Ubiquitin carboxyl-terminal hydrolase 27-like n=1 Tax=Hibiscus syriacus TaxID=106335 RepID=A0A6A3ATW4_HIBSY|nr:uncharacterized protein LOC120122919 [Hibiscus syriacus]KAE8706827.1 ubiquitin carboxyl-terminal hydrolase 27-like [Hibiscus syriacus]